MHSIHKDYLRIKLQDYLTVCYLHVQLWKQNKEVNSCGARCFCMCSATVGYSRHPSRFLCFELVSRGCGRRWGESERAGFFDLFLSNGRASWEEPRVCKANCSQSRERTRHPLRVACTRELEQLLYAARQRAGALLAWKNDSHVFCGLEKETGKAMLHYLIITGRQNCALINISNGLKQ